MTESGRGGDKVARCKQGSAIRPKSVVVWNSRGSEDGKSALSLFSPSWLPHEFWTVTLFWPYGATLGRDICWTLLQPSYKSTPVYIVFDQHALLEV